MQDLTKGKTFWVLFKFAIPLIIAGVISQSYNMIDLIIAGKVIGNDALGATGVSTTLIQFLSSLFWGFGVAVSAVVGRYYGAKKFDKIPGAIKTITIAVAVAMFVICLMCFIMSYDIMVWFKADPLIIDDANRYFKIFSIALFIQALTYIWTCILQSLGNSRYPMAMTLISGVGNVGLNLLFVMVFKMGVVGLAYATILSNLISFVMGFIKIMQSIKVLGGNYHFEFSWYELKHVSKLAIPCVLQQCSLYLSSVICQPLINDLGKEVSAGYSIAMNVNTLFSAFFHSVSRAVSAYVSQSKGAKEYDNYKKGIAIGFVQQIIVLSPIIILCAIFPNEIFSIFLKDKNDASCLPYATQFLTICIPFMIFNVYGNLMHSFYKAVGSVKTVLFTTIIFSAVRIVLSYTIPNVDLIFNIYLALGIAWAVEAIVEFVLYLSGIWKSSNHKAYDKMKKASAN